MRVDILSRIKECDGMLTDALSMFRVRLVLQHYPSCSPNQALRTHRQRWPSVFTIRSLSKAVR